MQVQEKARRIDATITGSGAEIIRRLIYHYFPEAIIHDDDVPVADDDEYMRWEDSDLYHELCLTETPGRILRAYRLRENLSLIDLAKKSGIKYTVIAAMERDVQEIDDLSAQCFAEILRFDFHRLLI